MASELRNLRGIEALPPEILANVFAFLDSPAPSDTRLHDQPNIDMLHRDERDLKNASIVSKKWRAQALPFLFRHAVFHLDRWDLLLAESDPASAIALPGLKFIVKNSLARAVRSLTIFVSDSMSGFYSLRTRSASRSESDRITSGSLARHRAGNIHGLRMADGSMSKARTYSEDNNSLWRAIFDVVDPLRFTLIASPDLLASLLSRMLCVADAWCFDAPFHVLSMSRQDRKRGDIAVITGSEASGSGKDQNAMEVETTAFSQTSTDWPDWPHPNDSSSTSAIKRKRIPCDLFTIRPWSSLLLNEGSFLKVYTLVDFFDKRPPSILDALLGAGEFPNNQPLIPQHIRTFEYVGIFPLQTHVHRLVESLPPVDRFFLQLVPRNDILNDQVAMHRVDPQDLWGERNTTYSLIINMLLTGPLGNWRYLKEFVSGDAADVEAWEMAVDYMTSLDSGWEVGGEGVFLRKESHGEGEETANPPDDGQHSAGLDNPLL